MMSLGKYVSHAHMVSMEITNSMTIAEIDMLRQELKGMDIKEWWLWKDNHAKQISLYVSSTPSERKKKNIFKDLMPKLVLASYQHCAEGYSVLKAIESNLLFPGQSYRGMAASAGDAFQEITGSLDVMEWPFKSPTPFIYNL